MTIKSKVGGRITGKVVWEPAPTEFTDRAPLVEIYGDNNTGKSSLALSARGPIAYLHASEKVSGIIQPFAGKVDGIICFGGSMFDPSTSKRDANKVEAGHLRDLMEAAWYDALGRVNTLIVDTHNEGWEVTRIAEFGGLKPVKGIIQKNYERINGQWLSMLNAAKQQTKTLVILLGSTSDEWKKSSSGQGAKTGRTIRGTHFSYIPRKSEVIIRTSRSKDGNFKAVIEKGWLAPQYEYVDMFEDEADTSIEDRCINLPDILSMCSGTDSSEWE